MGNPKSGFELSNKSKSGMFNANSINIERITNFCSCLFFIVRYYLFVSKLAIMLVVNSY